jgi:hypothetical protein
MTWEGGGKLCLQGAVKSFSKIINMLQVAEQGTYLHYHPLPRPLPYSLQADHFMRIIEG